MEDAARSYILAKHIESTQHTLRYRVPRCLDAEMSLRLVAQWRLSVQARLAA